MRLRLDRRRGTALTTVAVATAALVLASMRPVAAQVIVIEPDPTKRSASAATTIMLDPFYLLGAASAATAHAVPAPEGGVMLSQPGLGMSYFVAETRTDGTVGAACLDAATFARKFAGAADDPEGSEADEASGP